MSLPVGKCPNMERSDLFSLIGKQKKIAHLIAGHPVCCGYPKLCTLTERVIKCETNKKLTNWNFVSKISPLKNQRYSKIFVPTPHITLVIMWGRDMNVPISIIRQLRNCENKISLREFFVCFTL
jgi:hypothetical protein